MFKLVDVAQPMEEGNDVKSRVVTSILLLVDVAEPMEEGDDAK